MNKDLKAAFKGDYKKSGWQKPSWLEQFDWDNIKFYFRLSFKTCRKITSSVFDNWRKRYE